MSIVPANWVTWSISNISRVGLALFVWLVFVLMGQSGLSKPADLLFEDFVAGIFETSNAREDIVVVAIDAPSFQDIGAQWPWPRDIHAELIRQLKMQGARAIIFDVVFDQPSSADRLLAEAMKSAGNVYLAAERAITISPQGRIESLSMPTGPLLSEARGVGVAGVTLDVDGRLRRLPEADDSIAYVLANGISAMPASHATGTRERYIRFARGPDRPMRVSYYQALSAEHMLSPGTFADKIVLIGLALEASPESSRSTADSINVPYYASAHGFMHGVEAQADIIATTIAGDALVPAPASTGLVLWLLAIAVSLWVVIIAREDIAGAALVVFLGSACVVVICGVARANSVVVSDSTPLLGLVLISSGFISQSGLIAFRERRRLVDAFGRYVSPGVLQRLLDDPSMLSLGGAMRDVSVVVTDLQGYTSLMESVEPEQGADVIREYLDQIGQVVLRHGGMIDQFVGDSIIALFNAPAWQTDHARRALECARDIIETGQRLSLDFQARGVMLGETRAGADCGAAMVGNFGTQNRFHYTAMGDVVNIAARLEVANKKIGTNLLVTSRLFEAAGEPDGFLPAARLLLAGRHEPVVAVTLATSLSEQEYLSCRELSPALLIPNTELAFILEGRLAETLAGSDFFEVLQRLAGLARGEVVEIQK